MTKPVTYAVNILDKTDRSLAPVPCSTREIAVSKKDKFNWSTGGLIGDFRWIDKAELNIDERYQRNQVSDDKVMEIARHWDWVFLGTITVIEREDGSLWVLDGGHRTRAAFYRDDITALPCMVHQMDDLSAEAKAFVARNTMITNVSAYDRYRASICAEEPIALQVEKLLDEFGLTAVRGGTSKSGFISCFGALQSCVEENAEDAKKVLGFVVELAGDKIVVGKVLLAMFILYRHFKPHFDIIDRYGDKLRRHSQLEIEKKLREFATLAGRSGATVWAKGLLDLINHKLRNKIMW